MYAGRTAKMDLPPVVALGLVAVAVALQLIPLPRDLLSWLSPSTALALSDLHPGFAVGVTATHPISIHPASTRTALTLLLAFAFLMLGTARLLAVCGATRVLRPLAGVGVLLALIGIIQKALFDGEIYGFWSPIVESANPFGPFVNKNHFAGWMLMAVPLVLGLICADIARGMRGVKPELRERILWLSSRDASRLVMLCAAAMVMSLSLVLTMSRSGMGALALALVLTAWFVLRGSGALSTRVVTLSYLGLLVAIVVAWAGLDAIAARFAASDWTEVNNRRGAWIDAWTIASRFPLTGTGLNTYGVATLLFQEHSLTTHFVQAHNDYLQLAAEGGVLLCAPIALAILVFAVTIRARLREDTGSSTFWIRAGAGTSLVAIALQSIVEFSLQMPGNAVLFAVTGAVALHRSPVRTLLLPSPSAAARPNTAAPSEVA